LLQATGFKQLETLKTLEQWISRISNGAQVELIPAKARQSLQDVLDLSSGAKLSVNRLRSYLDELSFPAMNARLSDVLDAHPKTFEYMFDDEPKLTDVSFKKWLEEGEGIFHIAGKPGSGKSTLMKYLVRQPRTKQSLQKWTGEKELVLANFFFWKYGDPLQRNVKGLLRTILYELLSNCPDFLDSLFASSSLQEEERRFHYTGRQNLVDRDIYSAFDRLVQAGKNHESSGHRFCFFIDGLDEFGESEENYSDLVCRLQQWTQVSSGSVKLCVSSRTLPVFRQISLGQKIYLHDLTKSDIEKVVNSKITVLPRFQALRKKSKKATEECDNLVQEIMLRAEGVFLWVHLVLRTLRKGLLENGDSIIKLRQKLDLIPSELDAFFQHMMDSIEQPYRMEAYWTFAVAMKLALTHISYTRSMSLFRYSLLFDILEDPQFGLDLPCGQLSPEEIDSKLSEGSERLSARCNSLLEIRPMTHEYLYVESLPRNIPRIYQKHVTFIHRSVPEWLEEHLRERILGFDAEEVICHSLLAQIKSVALDPNLDPDLAAMVTEDLTEVCRTLQKRHRLDEDAQRSKSLLPLLKLMDEALCIQQGIDSLSERQWAVKRIPILPSGVDFPTTWVDSRPRVVSLSHIAAVLGLEECLKHLLSDNNLVAKGYGTSLLECLVYSLIGFQFMHQSVVKSTLSILFESGASVHARPIYIRSPQFSKVTIWYGFLATAFHHDEKIATDLTSWDGFRAAVEVFLEHGAVPYFSLTYKSTQKIRFTDPVLRAECGEDSYERSEIAWETKVKDLKDLKDSSSEISMIVSLVKEKKGRATLLDLTEFYSPSNSEKIVGLIRKNERSTVERIRSIKKTEVNPYDGEGSEGSKTWKFWKNSRREKT
jgi:energy-coupling factor transporter ATP-binding protein EcfA2